MAKRKNYEEIRTDMVLSCQEPQLELFETAIKESINDFMHLKFDNRGYTVNDKVDEIADSKINAIGLFSGGGGLDIGSQLAGVKVISSLDFDKDSVSTLKSNKYFSHAEHFLKDIQDVSAVDFTSILKKNNPEKLILVGGPPCQPFSKADIPH